MTSVVDTSVKHFHSGMFAAPVLNGVAGALLGVLNACLITGFDTKTATSLVVAGGVATLSFSGSHSATVDSVVLLSGSSIDALNGEQKVTAIGSGVVRFATAEADATATGTITFKMAPAGWTQPFTGTNLATYKSADPASTGMILRVDDTTTMQARVVGYEQATDINTGVGPFPTPAMSALGGYWAKSWAAGATAVPWSIVADGRLFYINIAANASINAIFLGNISRGFGDMTERRPGGDPYACTLNCHTDAAASPASAAMAGSFSSGATFGKCFMPRDYTGLGSAVKLVALPLAGTTNHLSGGDTRFGDFPPPFGELLLSPKILAVETSGINSAPRANLPGYFHIPHTKAFDTFKTGDTFLGTGALTGRRLMTVVVTESVSASNSSNMGAAAIDITGPWR